MIYPRTNVLERRKDVTRLLVRGYTPSEIAKGLKISRETVYNDVRHIRSGQNEDLAEHGRKQMLAQVMLNARARVKELWSVVEKSESPYVKLLALRELRIHDQQVLNHIFLFTQATKEVEKDLADSVKKSPNSLAAQELGLQTNFVEVEESDLEETRSSRVLKGIIKNPVRKIILHSDDIDMPDEVYNQATLGDTISTRKGTILEESDDR